MRKQHEHAITVYKADEILSRIPEPSIEMAPPMVYCDSEGECFFDEAPNPYLGAIVELLDDRGRQGWVLVQVVPRERDLICFWRRERTEG
jgi:hypothetical protein